MRHITTIAGRTRRRASAIQPEYGQYGKPVIGVAYQFWLSGVDFKDISKSEVEPGRKIIVDYPRGVTAVLNGPESITADRGGIHVEGDLDPIFYAQAEAPLAIKFDILDPNHFVKTLREILSHRLPQASGMYTINRLGEYLIKDPSNHV